MCGESRLHGLERGKRWRLYQSFTYRYNSPLSGSLPEKSFVSAEPIAGTHIDYLNNEWMKCRNEFHWTDTSIFTDAFGYPIPIWNGNTAMIPNTGNTNPKLPGNESMIPYISGGIYEVWSGEQLYYALNNILSGQKILLMRSIDLNGDEYEFLKMLSTSGITIDGQGNTIYNLAVYNGVFFQQFEYGEIKNLTVKSIKMINGLPINELEVDKYAQCASGLFKHFHNSHIQNVYVENSLFYSAKGAAFPFTGTASISTNLSSTIDNCGVKNTFCYGLDSVAGFSTSSKQLTVTNSYAVDGVVISKGGQSGGFCSSASISSSFSNCFTNNKVFGSLLTGVFMGPSANDDDKQTTFTNCYTAGSLEGVSNLGGFISSGFNCIFTNCYSTSIVGMMNGGKSQGGFAGTISKSILVNCYAAGEVGSNDTISSSLIGGFCDGVYFLSSLKNCYYDMQTTAMRERGIATSGIADTAIGVYTTGTIKSGTLYTGLTDSPGLNGFKGFTPDQAAQWHVIDDDMYPQLNVFVNPTTFSPQSRDLAKAFSKASVCTVQLNTWSKDYNGNDLGKTSYDTVRDVTIKFPMTSNNDTTWKKDNSIQSFYGSDHAVLMLEKQFFTWIADNFIPGTEWLEVNVTVNQVTGKRRLRIIPTMNIMAGKSRTVPLSALYDHADDVKFAYTTALRVAANPNDITIGIYPDLQLTDEQIALQGSPPANFNDADDKFTLINLDHMVLGSTVETVITPIESIDPVTSIITKGVELPIRASPDAEIQKKWNGKKNFESIDIKQYLIEYYWILQDGRYLKSSKFIDIALSSASLKVKVQNEDNSPNRNGLSIGVGGGSSLPEIDSREEKYLSIDYGTPGIVSWKANNTATEILGINIRIYDENETKYTESLNGELEGKYFTAGYTYRNRLITDEINYYAPLTYENKIYTITKDSNGIYSILFDKTVNDISGQYFSDMEKNIEITLTVRTTELKLQIRQVVLNSKETLSVPDTSNMVFSNVNTQSYEAPFAVYNQKITSGKAISNDPLYPEVPYTLVNAIIEPGYDAFLVKNIIPMNYKLVRFDLGKTKETQMQSLDMIIDFKDTQEYYATFFIEPVTQNPEMPYCENKKINKFNITVE